MYDLVIVGAGISAATLCACLKNRLRICVLEMRAHLGGNCHDRKMNGSYVHTYGPHIFHSTSQAVVDLLSAYTEWTPYEHRVQAEIELDGRCIDVPFPYSRQAEHVIGRALSESEVIDAFFRGYSQKMWGTDWEQLPTSVRGRVPKDTADHPRYFPNQFVAMPTHGFTHLIENMFDGVELVLNAGPRDWETLPATHVVHTGRPDHIAVPNDRAATFGQAFDLELPHRDLDIAFSNEPWPGEAACRNFCSTKRSYTRKTCYARLTGGSSSIVSTETPRAADAGDPTPFYPIPLAENVERHRRLIALVREHYPNVSFCGRLATYKYLDMHQAVGQAIAHAKSAFGFRPSERFAASL